MLVSSKGARNNALSEQQEALFPSSSVPFLLFRNGGGGGGAVRGYLLNQGLVQRQPPGQTVPCFTFAQCLTKTHQPVFKW